MRIALCNEVLADRSFAEQCRYAAALGYDGLEVAPYTLGENPLTLSDKELLGYQAVAASHGLTITSLHWLLVAPAGLSIVSADSTVRQHTLAAMQRLIEQCALLGAEVLVHGSPGQRRLEADGDRERAEDYFDRAGELAQKAGVTYCIEPLAPRETNYLNTLAETADLVRRLNRPGLKTMLDTSAAAHGETESPAAVLDAWLDSGLVAHVQLNDRNRRAPGQGDDAFLPVLETLIRHGYSGTLAVEPFIYEPDGATTAARAIGYLHGLREALA
ncbi:sugar phosphate isomerase/epimerase family protein [Saccharospirillum sp. HFRX-1]|uniref:sugar phosphate isomerase/epimerase family protein n=1 Tax=unclassified Saccharospirillum TaxID=2633430 RepID=UPI003710CA40